MTISCKLHPNQVGARHHVGTGDNVVVLLCTCPCNLGLNASCLPHWLPASVASWPMDLYSGRQAGLALSQAKKHLQFALTSKPWQC